MFNQNSSLPQLIKVEGLNLILQAGRESFAGF